MDRALLWEEDVHCVVVRTVMTEKRQRYSFLYRVGVVVEPMGAQLGCVTNQRPPSLDFLDHRQTAID